MRERQSSSLVVIQVAIASLASRFVTEAAHVYDIRDGKVYRFRQFTDTNLLTLS